MPNAISNISPVGASLCGLGTDGRGGFIDTLSVASMSHPLGPKVAFIGDSILWQGWVGSTFRSAAYSIPGLLRTLSNGTR